MVGPGCRSFTAHHQNILDHLVHSIAGVGEEVVEEAKGADVEYTTDWKLSQEKVQSWYWGGLAELQEPSQSLILEYFQRLAVNRSDRKCREA